MGLRLLRTSDTTPSYPLMDDPALMHAIGVAMAGTGWACSTSSWSGSCPGSMSRAWSRFLAAGAELGARHVLTAAYDPDLARLADRLGALTDPAGRHCLRPVLESFPWTPVKDLASAVSVVGAAGWAETGILVDALHFDRSGSRLEQLDAVPAPACP